MGGNAHGAKNPFVALLVMTTKSCNNTVYILRAPLDLFYV